MSGIYDVKSFIRNGDTIPPLLTDASRWKRLVVDINENILYSMKDMYLPQKVELDTLKSVATISLYNDPEKKCELKYRAVNKDSLVFSGTLFKDSVFITFKKFDLSKYTLVNRGFHWINEYPFNR